MEEKKEAKRARGKATFVGYKIHADKHNWKVVVVKQYSAASKNSGKEYTRSLFHCKTIEEAASWLFNYDARNRFFNKERIEDAVSNAKNEILKAIEELKKS